MTTLLPLATLHSLPLSSLTLPMCAVPPVESGSSSSSSYGSTDEHVETEAPLCE